MNTVFPVNEGDPLYRQVEQTLRQRIQLLHYRPGDRLPTEAVLAEEFGVSTITCRRALQELATAGLIVRRPGVGTVVAPPAARPALRGTLDNLLENLILVSDSIEYTVRHFAYEPVPEDVAVSLGLSPGETVQHVETIGRRGEALTTFVRAYVPEDLGRQYAKEDLRRAACIVLLMRHGTVIGRVEERISACPAPADIASALSVKAGEPLLHIGMTIFDVTGRGVELVDAYSPWDQTEYRTTRLRGG